MLSIILYLWCSGLFS